MKVLITGGNGFIARNLEEQLKDEYRLVSLNSQKLNLLDTQKISRYLKSNLFDIVIHTATYDAAPKHSTKDPTKVLENNLRMFFNIARCRDDFGRMIYFGSGAEFDRAHWRPKMKESYFDRHVPTDQYGLSKYIMTKYTLSTDKIQNLRLFAVFGKYDDWKVRLISNICHNASLGLPLIINQNKRYDFISVEDLAKIVKSSIKGNLQKKVYNVCSGEVVDFKTIAKKVIKKSGQDLKLQINLPGLGQEYSGDNSLLLSEFDRFKFTPIDESIENLYDWYNNQAKDK